MNLGSCVPGRRRLADQGARAFAIGGTQIVRAENQAQKMLGRAVVLGCRLFEVPKAVRITGSSQQPAQLIIQASIAGSTGQGLAASRDGGTEVELSRRHARRQPIGIARGGGPPVAVGDGFRPGQAGRQQRGRQKKK